MRASIYEVPTEPLFEVQYDSIRGRGRRELLFAVRPLRTVTHNGRRTRGPSKSEFQLKYTTRNSKRDTALRRDEQEPKRPQFKSQTRGKTQSTADFGKKTRRGCGPVSRRKVSRVQNP